MFIRQHFASYFSDTPKSNTTYYAVLAKEDRIKLDSFIKATEFTNYDTLYYEDYVDGIDYQFYIENDSSERLVRVHTDSAPAQLNSLMNWIITTKEKLKICPLDSTIGFGSTKNFLPPRVPPPLTEFTEPKVE